MLKVHVQSEAVQRNINLFKRIVRKFHQGNIRSCDAVVNRVTGAMRFSEMAGLNPNEWKHIVIQINLNAQDVQVFEEKGKEGSFECKDLEPTAYRIMTETLRVLQQLIGQLKDFKELSYFEIEASPGGRQDIVHEAWHQLDRAEAESFLKEHTTGTYFFRKDRYAALLEHELTEAHCKAVKCVTLTFLDSEQIVRDRTIVRYNERWLFYNDDPTLSGESFASIRDLLASMGAILRQPLLASRHP